ncbi:NmrA/HSCARG family protein [Kitasatospora acidiphila]|uniref:NmrA/HSCARG family protein n=1 Tax=Kitasatospora acidiphila TaxID=2567942 RepID=A0A540VZU8_9ACTN|nr:NmrA/HSCARG family protein [Kitasatospora acidiphila]TQF02296.1 NmrA/HSCARG family protein [Kitasatospora acidiphila]
MTQEFYAQSLPVAVTGATGTQGGAAVHALLCAGRTVRALTRDVTSPAAAALRELGVDVVRADFDEPESLLDALRGAGALFAMSTPFRTDLETEVRQGIALLDAARAAGTVAHVVFTSATNADLGTGIPHFDSKWRIERHLVSLGLPWTVLGPGAFMENYANGWTLQSLREGYFSIPMPVDRPLPVVAAADIGAMAALALTDPERFAGRRIDLASQWRTPAQIAAAISAASGREITAREVPLAVAEGYSPDLAAMFRYFQEVGLTVDIPALHHDYPQIDWHTFENWAAARQWNLDATAGQP